MSLIIYCIYVVWLTSQPSSHDKLVCLHWQHLFFVLIGLPLKLSYSLLSSLFSTSPSSLGSLFGLQWNFDARPLPRYRELNMPCPGLLSAATFIPLASNAALKPSENALFSEKHIIQMSSAGTFQLVVFLLCFGSALLIFLLVCLWRWPCSRGKSNYCRPLKAPRSFSLNLFLKHTLFFCVWTDVMKARMQPCSSDIILLALVGPVFVGLKADDECDIFIDSMKQCHLCLA